MKRIVFVCALAFSFSTIARTQGPLTMSPGSAEFLSVTKNSYDIRVGADAPDDGRICFDAEKMRCVTYGQLRAWLPADGSESKPEALERINLHQTKALTDLQAKEQACQGQLGPLLFQQNSQVIQQQAAALKASREKERPGYDYDVITGTFTKKPTPAAEKK